MRNALKILFENIDPTEQQGWRDFVKEHKRCDQHVSGNGISVELMGDTVGGYVILMKCTCGAMKNITNFDNW